MNAFAQALELLGRKGVDFGSAGCRACAPLALWGYCQAARQLEREKEILQMITRWRPEYLPWLKSPATSQEREFLARTEQLFHQLGGSA